jgi:heme/copper-type cytochrome/quinol oxidase subunit 2
MTKRITDFRDVNNKRKFLIIYMIIPIIVIIFVLYFSSRSYDEFYRQMATQEQCAKKCASYGITPNDLVGPKMEYSQHTKFTSNYIFSWQSGNPAVSLKVHEYHKSSTDPETIEFEWVSSK